MTRFNLEALPLCGAKTRQGSPCKRRGNKRNGRCKLHGGNSTGAKTIEGKLAVRANPIKNGARWYIAKGYDLELIRRSQLAFLQLADLATQGKPNQSKVISVVREHRVALECFKYRILEHYGSDAFIVIQSALDAFYMDNDANHLHFHIHTKTAKAPYFQRQISSPQKKGVLINKQSTL